MVLFVIWFLLLIPWWRIGMLASGLAFDNGPTFHAYGFAWSIWTYPVILLIALALALGRKKPRFVFLRVLNALVFCIAGFVPPS
jgi:hypothetical protein